MKPIIKIENLSKQYRLGNIGTGTLSHDLNRWWHTIRGKEDPYLKIGEANDRASKGNSDYVWAMRDINLEVMPGEVLGIIGKNGAGKSTLLKLLSRVTGPTTGSIKTRGRLASLLEVGTGFHPELTGRDNIFLNGAILGMTKSEINKKFDEIVDFAGCERYIDTPVKRYSSGMYVRLAFAVAAHLEPEILVVDEVLAVGDAEFQKKAIGKMQDVSKNEGRTVLFVSHNMSSIKQLCTRAILLDKGGIVFSGNVEDTIDFYKKDVKHNELIKLLSLISTNNTKMTIDSIMVNDSIYNEVKLVEEHNDINIKITGVLHENISFELEARFYDQNLNPVAFYSPGHYVGSAQEFKKGKFSLERKISLPRNINHGDLTMQIAITRPGIEVFLELSPEINIILEGYKMKTGWVFENTKAGILFLK